MDAVALAARVIAHLHANEGAPSYSWVCVGHEIFSPDELKALTDEEIRERWALTSATCTQTMVWSCRGYARSVGNGWKTLHGRFWGWDKVSPPVILFWPPRYALDWPELVTWWGNREEVVDCLVWLVQQPLPIYAGAREPIYGGSAHEPILPLSLKSLFHDDE